VCSLCSKQFRPFQAVSGGPIPLALRLSHGQIHFPGLAEGIPAKQRRQEAKLSGGEASKYRALGLHILRLYRERSYLRAGRVRDGPGAILLELCSCVREQSLCQMTNKNNASPVQKCGCLFPTNFLTSISFDDSYRVLIVMLLSKCRCLPTPEMHSKSCSLG